MFCGKCGTRYNVGAAYCPMCGNKLPNPYTVNTMMQPNNFHKKNFIASFIGGGIILVIIFFVIFTFSGDISQKYCIVNCGGGTTTSTTNTNVASVDDRLAKDGNIISEADLENRLKNIFKEEMAACKSNKVKNISSNMISSYGYFATSLCTMDENFIEQQAKYVAKMYKEFPILNNTLDILYMISGPFECSTAIACMGLTGVGERSIITFLTLSPSYFQDLKVLERSVTRGSSQGQFPPNSNIYFPLLHELGHNIEAALDMKKAGYVSGNRGYLYAGNDYEMDKLMKFYNYFKYRTIAAQIVEEAAKNINNKRLANGQSSLSIDELQGSISAYAKTDYGETIAESVHDYYANGTKAQPFSLEIIRLLKIESSK